MSEILLYHGSNQAVEKPKILPIVRALDFGAGFYMTSDYDQAARWAAITVKRRAKGKPSVSVFSLEQNKFEDLKILSFDSPCADWLRFISMHRSDVYINDIYDVIIGPVADDNTMPVINLYLRGDYTEEEAIKRLLPQRLKNQYVFKTSTALELLTFKEAIIL